MSDLRKLAEARPSHEERQRLTEAAAARDGNQCWLCAGKFERFGSLSRTLEHLTPKSHGGTWESDNIFLAHKQCNELMGDMTRQQKVRFRRGLGFVTRPPIRPPWARQALHQHKGERP